MLIDTHCHLDAQEFDGDRDAVMAEAAAGGVGMIIVPAVERANFGAVASVCRSYSGCAAAYGIHPMYVDRAVPDDLQALADTVERERPVAIGEIGLDRFVEPRDEQRQQELFVAQLKLARNHDLPVLLHVRRAIDQVLAQLRQVRVVGGIAHAFNGSRQQADEFIKLGFKLGFGGTLTYPGSQRIRALAASLPDEAIVLETDAPDIPPEWIARGRNTPGQLPLIAQMLAELRGTPVPDIIRQTHANALAVLPRLATIPPHGIH